MQKVANKKTFSEKAGPEKAGHRLPVSEIDSTTVLGIGCRGIPEREGGTPNGKLEHNKQSVQMVLGHLDVKGEITICNTLGRNKIISTKAKTSSPLKPAGNKYESF